MIQSRAHLSSVSSVYQAAWRNFDPGAIKSSRWASLFIGDATGRGTSNENWDNLIDRDWDLSKRLCYYYLVCTDDTVSRETLEARKANFITKLADFRRGHNDCTSRGEFGRPNCRMIDGIIVHDTGDSGTLNSENVSLYISNRCRAVDADDPSCDMGVTGRMGQMGEYHPTAQLTGRIEDALTEY